MEPAHNTSHPHSSCDGVIGLYPSVSLPLWSVLVGLCGSLSYPPESVQPLVPSVMQAVHAHKSIQIR